MNLTYIGSLEAEWSVYVEHLFGALNHINEFVTLNVSGALIENCEPFVQASKYDGDILVLEAVSENFLDVPLSMRAFVALRYLAWNDPSPQNPNHHNDVRASTPSATISYLLPQNTASSIPLGERNQVWIIFGHSLHRA